VLPGYGHTDPRGGGLRRLSMRGRGNTNDGNQGENTRRTGHHLGPRFVTCLTFDAVTQESMKPALTGVTAAVSALEANQRLDRA
jgi:hypothetical protein